jgi:hypothetical protein
VLLAGSLRVLLTDIPNEYSGLRSKLRCALRRDYNFSKRASVPLSVYNTIRLLCAMHGCVWCSNGDRMSLVNYWILHSGIIIVIISIIVTNIQIYISTIAIEFSLCITRLIYLLLCNSLYICDKFIIYCFCFNGTIYQ